MTARSTKRTLVIVILSVCLSQPDTNSSPFKTELLWAGSKRNITMLGSRAPAMQLGSDTVTASNHVRVLGVTFSSDLTLEKHVSKT